MPSDQVELVWSLLKRSKLEEIKQVIPKNFCWSMLHPESKTTILVEACRLPIEFYRSEKSILELIEWLVKSGASLSQKCGKSDSSCQLFCGDSDFEVKYAGHNLLTYIDAWYEIFYEDEDWEDERAFLDKVLTVLARASSQHTRPRASIDEGIVEFWMLMGASPVVQAMLGSPMKEGNGQTIHLGDTSSGAVQLFVEVLYTCSSQSDPVDWESALSALDLAHRWQVEPVVAILADLLPSMLAEDNFSAITEQAALKGLDQLMQQCQKFGAGNATIQKQIKKGQLPKLVQKLFQANPPKATAATAAKKRKRL